MDIEIWKDISKTGGEYQISSLGRVRNSKGFVLKDFSPGAGYRSIGIMIGGKRLKAKIHRLVFIHFLENPENKPYVNHKNGIKHDNRLANLEWSTPSENVKHSYECLNRIPYFTGRTGAKHHCSKPVMAKNILTGEILNYDSAKCALKDGFKGSAIAQCCLGRKKQYKGYVWEYAK